MKRLILFCSTFLILALAACAAQPSSEQFADEGDAPLSSAQAVDASDSPVVTVYRSPT